MSDKMEGPVNFETGIQVVHNDYVMRVIHYLETGKMVQSHSNYIKCYS